MNFLRLASTALVLWTLLTPACTWSQSWIDYPLSPLYPSYVEAGGRFGDHTGLSQNKLFLALDLSQGDLLLTTVQREYELLFADIRGNWADSRNWTGNFGVGYRNINPGGQGWILGRYVFLDRMRSAKENNFIQGSIGLELMSIDWDFRINGYFPRHKAKALGQPRALYAQDTIVVSTPAELAYDGFDIEAGYLVADSEDASVELRAFTGGYFFGRNDVGYDQIVGSRTRLELRWFDIKWLGDNSRVMIGAQYQWDDLRKGIASGLLSVRIPMGPLVRPRLNRLQRRMLNPIVRESNIVTNSEVLTERALDAQTGHPFGSLALIDANTVDAPGRVADAGPGRLIVADGSAGQIDVNAPLIMQPNQTLRGAGFNVIGEKTGYRATFGSRPTIRGADPNQDVIVLANGVTVRDITIVQGQHGIYGDSVSPILLANNWITAAQMSGIRLDGDTRANILGNVSIGNGLDGATIDRFAAGTISDNVLSVNGRDGLRMNQLTGGTIIGNRAEGNTNDGFAVAMLSDGDSGGTVSNNLANGNADDGFQIDLVNLSVSNRSEFFNNEATGNTIGFHFVTIDGGRAENNSATNNTGDGFLVDTMSFGTLQNNQSNENNGNGFVFTALLGGSITDNEAAENDFNGFFFDTIVDGSVFRNTATANQLSGFAIVNSGGRIKYNTAEMNVVDGYTVVNLDIGFLDKNTADTNGRDGFFITNMTAGTSLSGNRATNNADDGFDIGSGIWSGGSVFDNVSASNTAFGFRITNRTGGSASGNVAIGNGDDTLPAP